MFGVFVYSCMRVGVYSCIGVGVEGFGVGIYCNGVLFFFVYLAFVVLGGIAFIIFIVRIIYK